MPVRPGEGDRIVGDRIADDDHRLAKSVNDEGHVARRVPGRIDGFDLRQDLGAGLEKFELGSSIASKRLRAPITNVLRSSGIAVSVSSARQKSHSAWEMWNVAFGNSSSSKSSTTPQIWSGWAWVKTTSVMSTGSTPAPVEVRRQLSGTGHEVRTRPRIEQHQPVRQTNQRGIAFRREAVRRQPELLDKRRDIGLWNVRQHEAERQAKMAVADRLDRAHRVRRRETRSQRGQGPRSEQGSQRGSVEFATRQSLMTVSPHDGHGFPLTYSFF